MRIEKKLEEMGVTLPEIPTNVDWPVIPGVQVGNLLFLTGVYPQTGSGTPWKGKVGRDYTTQEAYEAARWCAIALLAEAKYVLGDLDRVKRVVRVLGMVNSTDDFEEAPQVMNGCSDFLVEVFGEMGKHARSAVCMASLTVQSPVEADAIFEVE